MSVSPVRISQLLAAGEPGTSVDVSGWVRTRRDSKQSFSFIELNDGSCMANLQVVVDAGVPGYAETIREVHTGASLRVTGELKASPGAKQRVELHARTLELIGPADAEKFPLQKKRHSFEFLREIAHLRPRTNTFGAIARVRNRVSYAIHNFFQSRGFVYVHTPIITTSDCEGAGEMFAVTTLLASGERKDERSGGSQRMEDGGSMMDSATPSSILHPPSSPTPPFTPPDYSHDFFGKRASLTVSGQLEAEIFATSLGPCYTFGPTFRAENSNTPRHLAEFWMIEPEMPFYELPDDMQLAEDFIKHLIRDALEHCPEDMQFFNDRIDNKVLETLRHILDHRERQVVGVPRRMGSQPAGGARAVPHRAAFPAADHRVRLPAVDQAVLHVLQRRRQDRPRDGRARAGGGGDHRRQPARAPARRAGGAAPRMWPQP
jgi:asparaginyl-tRNA synthetase